MRHKKVLGLLALTQFLVVLDGSITNVALPAIQTALGFDETTLMWVVTAYALTFGGFLMLGGRAADLYGRRLVLVSGVIGFAAASLLIGLAQSEIMLIAARTVQGIAAAFMSPAALSILLTTYAEGPMRAKALSIWAAVASGGAAVGVFLGGLLTQYVGWEWNFFINVPIGLTTAWAIHRYIPEHMKEERDRSLDVPGALLVTGGLMAIVYGLARAGEAGWSGLTITALITGISLMVSFVYNETRAKHPLMPLSILRIRSLVTGNLVMVSVTSSMFAMFYFMSLYLQGTLRYSPLLTGLSFLVMPIIIGITSTLTPRLIDRFDIKQLLLTGLLSMACGAFLLGIIPSRANYLSDILPALILMAAGVGVAFVAATIAATSGVPPHEAGLASGILNTAQQIGGALGLAVLSLVAATVTTMSDNVSTATLMGYRAAFIAAGILLFSGLVVAALGLRRNNKSDQAKTASTSFPLH